jgi:hypothetical protein
MAVKGRTLGKGQTLKITEVQHQELLKATTGSGGNQTLCADLHRRAKRSDGTISTMAYPKELERMQDFATRSDTGTWQRIYREILEANGLL